MLDTLDSPYIHAANSDNFKSLVLGNSAKGPVLVNFWSKKAGPCLRQYPILDKLVHDYAGRVLLINVNTEKEIIFTKEYGIASVPTLKLFRYGAVVETLHGYQSEHDLVKMLSQYVARDSDQILAKAIKEYGEGRQTAAYEMIVSAIVDDPENARLPMAMCKLLKHEQRYADALKLLNTLPDALRGQSEIKSMFELIGFCLERESDPDVEKPLQSKDLNIESIRQRFLQLIIEQQFEPALEQLVAIMEREQSFDNNYAQQAMLRVFIMLGERHPIISKYRPNLKRYIYS